MMGVVSTYWHTLRHLRPIQFYGRLWFRMVRPSVDARPAPPRRPVVDAGWVLPAARRASLLAPQRFRFLNQIHDLDEGGWDDPSQGKLWRYNLHYFDDLNAFDAQARRDWHHTMLLRWVQENPPGMGTGWEPYPTSLRIVNWVKWALRGETLPEECIQSLAIQARWLRRRLEIHLLANHLFANAKALIFAGMFFEGTEAESWIATGLQILEREIPEQILPDGGQFERSTMYHALGLEDMLDLLNVTTLHRSAVPAPMARALDTWPTTIATMRRWQEAMCHPDGEISFFNDAAIGIAPSPTELERYAERLGLETLAPLAPGILYLEQSGYVRVGRDDGVTLIDIALIGPAYLPGHGHADTLSFEFSLFRQRVFVNSGTSCYGTDAERQRQRATSAHNTVVIDGENSSEVWGGFRVARRAHPVEPTVKAGPAPRVTCAHDGYDRLAGKPRHKRSWAFGERELRITDTITGTFRVAEARFHLHPAIALDGPPSQQAPANAVTLRLPGGQLLELRVDGGTIVSHGSTWHPEFGLTQPSRVLSVTLDGPELRTTLKWGSAQ